MASVFLGYASNSPCGNSWVTSIWSDEVVHRPSFSVVKRGTVLAEFPMVDGVFVVKEQVDFNLGIVHSRIVAGPFSTLQVAILAVRFFQ